MTVLRLIVALLLVWLAIRDADLATVGASLGNASGTWLVVALVLVLADRTLNAWRWVRLLRAVETQPPRPLRRLLYIFFVSTFVGTFLPGSVGGDAVRAISVSRLQVPGADAVGSVVVDRMLGVISMLLMALAGLWLAGGLVESRIIVLAGVLTIVAVSAALLLLFDSRPLTRLVQVGSGGRFPRLQRLAGRFLAGIRQYGHQRRVLAEVLLMSVLVQLLRALQAWCLGLALGVGIGGLWYLAFVPLIVLVVQLPIAISGLGTANLAFVELFGRAGVDPSAAFAMSVLFLALGWAGNLPGGALVLAAAAGRRH